MPYEVMRLTHIIKAMMEGLSVPAGGWALSAVGSLQITPSHGAQGSDKVESSPSCRGALGGEGCWGAVI